MSLGRFVVAWLLTLALSGARLAAAASPPLLDVPFVPQSEALCGGAAAAMVMRYWQSAPVYAEDFASLVSESADGITLGNLARAVRERGWRALPFAGTPSDVQGHLTRGRPVILLIEDRPGRHHYVVVVAWTNGRIVFHDPARGPFQVVEEEAFDRAWAVTRRTTLLILPDGDPVAAVRAESTAGDPASACGLSVDRAVTLARGGDLSQAESLLTVASEACPAFSGGPRELAGLRFLQKRWNEAVRFAEQAVHRDPSDMHAWQLLATARFLAGDPGGALAAWNRRHEPRVDLIRIDGLMRTGYEAVADLVDLSPQALLTNERVDLATRRVAALPTVGASRVSYSPGANGQASVDVAVVERPLVPDSWTTLASIGLHAAVDREARLDVASPSGNGELWTVAARWWEKRPRVALMLATPRLGPWKGLWRVEGSWERQSYERQSSVVREPSRDGDLIVSERRRAQVAFADWATSTVRWEVSGALDHWIDRGNRVSLGAAIDRRWLDDRLAIRAYGAAWPGVGDAATFMSGSVATSFRSAAEGAASWTGQMGLHAVSAVAPLDTWPGAGTGQARAPLLRAHPLLVDGAIRAHGLGRVLAHGTVEYQRRVLARSLGELRLAAFADAARLARARTAVAIPLELDVGVGLRTKFAGAPGVMRVDLARGMRDGHIALSAGWQMPWPGW